MGFWDGLASAMDDIRHNVVEIPMYGREVTGSIELPKLQEAAIEAPASYQEMMQQDVGKIEPPAPQQDMGMEH
jgi:hypothetical protein